MKKYNGWNDNKSPIEGVGGQPGPFEEQNKPDCSNLKKDINQEMVEVFGDQSIEMNDIILKVMEAGGIDRNNKAIRNLLLRLAIQVQKKQLSNETGK